MMHLNKANIWQTLGAATVMILGTQSCTLYENLKKGGNVGDEQKETTLRTTKKDILNEDFIPQNIDTNKVFPTDLVCVRDLMLELAQVLKCRRCHEYSVYAGTNGNIEAFDVFFKDEEGKFIPFVLKYDSDLAGIPHNRSSTIVQSNKVYRNILQDANTIITFKWKGHWYRICMTFDPEHKAELYGMPDGSKFEFQSGYFPDALKTYPPSYIDRGFSLFFEGALNNNAYKGGAYDRETGPKDIKNAIVLLDEILKSYPCSKDSLGNLDAQNMEKEWIKETEEAMNVMFAYGQKMIFKNNLSKFNDASVKEGLNTLYDVLEKHPSLKIKITGYYGGIHPTLPLDRAERVKKYLARKGISKNRMTARGGEEKIAQSIKIEIIN